MLVGTMVVFVGYKKTEYFKKFGKVRKFVIRNFKISVADPDPNPHVFGPPGSGSFYHHAKIEKW